MTMKKVEEGKVLYPDNFPPVCKDLLEKILVADVEQRLGLEEMKEHPFFEEVDFAKIFEKAGLKNARVIQSLM